MNQALTRRLAAMTGLTLAAAVALWWLGSTRLALAGGSDASRSSADALQALLLVRGMALAMLSVRIGALGGWRAGAAVALALIAPAWPLVLLAWSASTTPLTQLALSESLLLAAGLALPLIGLGLRRALRQAEPAEVVATAVGVALAASVWAARGLWTLPLS
jgi:hypothetical protein